MRIVLCTLLILLSSTALVSQALEGMIKDELDEPIANAQILNSRTGNHTHSSEDGVFQLQEAGIGDILEVSHLQYVNKNVVVNSLEFPLLIILSENVIALDEIVISPELDALNVITDIDLQTNPVRSSQDILQQVPGLIIGQHAGGGKAEQIFLRGFDIDHGTDITIQVDGLPVNMVSHAHGQGYADLHFLIPETVEKIDFGKGPYYANMGNFNTAGYVNFKTRDKLEYNTIKVESGQFNTNRFVGLFDLIQDDESSSFAAMEYLMSDGPFESPQNFNRMNLFAKYSSSVSQRDKMGIVLSYFRSKWDASGQIPQRAVDQGQITRFGSIDDTEGGTTARTNIQLTYDKFISDRAIITNRLYYTKYDFELFSNFTFYLEDPVNGDQIKQRESRDIVGWNSEYKHAFSNDNIQGNWSAGIELRNDWIQNNELSHTLNRKEILERIQLGDINETNMSTYFDLNLKLGLWTINPGIRFDHLSFHYNDALASQYATLNTSKSILSPKLNILYNHTDNLQLYFKSGKGFHSNDSRVVLEQTGREVLPAAYGFDVGFLWKPMSRFFVNTAYWYLFLEQEFVYVGDAGIVEPSDKTRRHGLDVSMRYQPLNCLFLNMDANYSNARAIGVSSGYNYIPLAPEITLAGGMTMLFESGIYGSAHIRYLQDRPANENNSIIAEGYSIVDVNLGYEFKQFDIGIQIQNLFDVEWKETQFATTSRLIDEDAPVEEIHFIPGTPFFIKAIAEFKF